MAKKILGAAKIGLGYHLGKAILGNGNKGPRGYGDPLPIGAINPDGSPIPVDKKRRRLAPNNILSSGTGPGSTLGG